MPTTKQTILTIDPQPGEPFDQTVAKALLQPSMLGSAVIDAYKNGFQGEALKIMQTQEVLAKSIEQLQAGDFSKVDEMLLSQASALEMMFTSLARRASLQQQTSLHDSLVKLAFKAQNQSRATLQTLMQRHQPKQTAFIKQANIAHGHQQVNNQGNPISSEKNISQPNQLLAKEKTHGSPQMDARTKTTAKRSHSTLETVGAIDRPKNARWKSEVC
jgi:hypothetical protein